jgi:hypothetical protein
MSAVNPAYAVNSRVPINSMDYLTMLQIQKLIGNGQQGGALKQYYDYFLFDSQIIAPNVTIPATNLNLFQNQGGQPQSVFGGAGSYTKQYLVDTNMQQGGMLPQGQFFVFNSIQVLFNLTGNCPALQTDTTTQNINRPISSTAFSANIIPAYSTLRTFLQMGSLQFQIGNRPFIGAPLVCYPTQFGVWGQGWGVGATTGQAQLVDSTANNGPGAAYQLQSPMLLVNGKNFQVNISWPYSFTTPANSYLQLFVFLVGTLYDSIM